MEETANRYLTGKCEVFHSTELSITEWEWLKEKPEWFERHLIMLKNKIIIEKVDWDDYCVMITLCRTNFKDFWYITKDSGVPSITVYALDKDELLKLKLTIEKQ